VVLLQKTMAKRLAKVRTIINMYTNNLYTRAFE
jgi:hypothetical protein